jgi:DNA-directed RNA polymerase specialized sigma24 family protein
MCQKREPRVPNWRCDYATHSDFCHALTEDMSVLYLLAFLLTTKHADAERCVSSAADQAFESNRVFREWVTSWIRRNLMISAIRLVFDISNGDSRKPDRWFSGQDELGSAVDAITHLADLDRCVFVMSLLERYSVHECSLLLGVSPRRIVESRISAMRNLPEVADVDEFISQNRRGADNRGFWAEESRLSRAVGVFSK